LCEKKQFGDTKWVDRSRRKTDNAMAKRTTMIYKTPVLPERLLHPALEIVQTISSQRKQHQIHILAQQQVLKNMSSIKSCLYFLFVYTL
jgi:hypothetical protein